MGNHGIHTAALRPDSEPHVLDRIGLDKLANHLMTRHQEDVRPGEGPIDMAIRLLTDYRSCRASMGAGYVHDIGGEG